MNDKELRKRYETNKYDPNLGYVPPHETIPDSV